MFWLPIALSIILFAWHLGLRRSLAISFDVFILFSTLDDELWHAAPVKIRQVVQRCNRALHQLAGLAVVSCVGLMGAIFTIIASYHGDPYQSSIVIVLCAIDIYGYFFMFRRLFEKLYATHRSSQLQPAINYLLTLSRPDA